MLSKSELVAIFERLGTPPKGRELILKARIEAPVREVRSQGGNVITIVASRKMGREIATESRHVEFPAAIQHEFDQEVLEYYAQPCTRKFHLKDSATGRIHSPDHTPDFLTIRADGFTLEEWKSNAKLQGLSERTPYRYVKGNDDLWRSPQIEEQLLALGIRYRIRTAESIPQCRSRNSLYLADYFHPSAEPCPESELLRLRAALHEHGALFFFELMGAPYSFSADHLNKAIADKQIVVALDHESLSEPRKFRLYRDEHTRDFLLAYSTADRASTQKTKFALNIVPGTRFTVDGSDLTISLAGEKQIICTDAHQHTVPVERNWLIREHDEGRIDVIGIPDEGTLNLSRYTSAQYQEANRRQAILISPSANGIVSKRTRQRWIARQRSARQMGGSEALALIPDISARGNRKTRLDPLQLEWMDRIYAKHWRNNKAINPATCYGFLKTECKTAGVNPPSYPTYIKYLKARETHADVRIRHGKRIAYQRDTFVDTLHYDTEVHGNRPFQYVHIDHTQLDLELISSRNGKPLGRPWLTIAIDAWSRRVVGIYLTYDPPSYVSVMMVVRDMVRRFHRLPEMIVVDNGRDFMSQAFETFLMTLGTHLRFRPAGQPRHGSVLERVFGRLNVEYIHNLAGNTKATKQVRMVAGSHLPKKLAEWTLEVMYLGIQHWATDFYDQDPHVALGESPREAFQRGLLQSGSRGHLHLQFNQDFLIATCPPVDRGGTRRVDDQTGVKVNHLYYWNSEFSAAHIAGRTFLVHFDPWDASSVYVRVKDKWLHAICRTLAGLGQRTDHERQAISEEFLRRNHGRRKNFCSEQRFGEFMETFEPEGAVATDFSRQAENRTLYQHLECGSINPTSRERLPHLDQQETSEYCGSPLPETPSRRKSSSEAVVLTESMPIHLDEY